MTDQQRGDTLLPGSKAIMPNARRLRERGVVFSNAFCASPHCCPSRATFFSGLYPSMHGVWNNVNVSNALSRGLYDNVRLFSEDLKENGYKMYFSGKWHVSSREGPQSRGFETVYHRALYHESPNLPDAKGWDLYKWCETDGEGGERGPAEIVRPGYPRYVQYAASENPFGDSKVAERAEEKLRELPPDEPFCMFVGPDGPHDPYIPPQRFLDMYDINDIELPESFFDGMEDKPALYRRTRDRFSQLAPDEHRECIRRYLAFCSYEDHLLGRLLDVLDERGMWEDTVVMYLSDHGDYAGAHGLWTKGLPCFREAYNICALVGGGPVVGPGRAEDALISLADFAPTILELAGIKKADRDFPGLSLAPILKNETPPEWRTELFTQTNGNEIYGVQRAVFGKEYKLVYNTFDYDEFYDYKNDPHETVNQINNPACKDKIRELHEKLWRFAYENQDGCVTDYIMTALAAYGPGCAIKNND